MILQSDPQWATVRCGHVTASRIVDVLAKSRDGKSWGQTRDTYMGELIAERLSGNPADSGYVSAAMQRGLDLEPQARAAYEFHTDATLGEAAFVKHPTIPWAGATPDGFIGSEGLAQFKIPNTATHIRTLLGDKIDRAYVLQVQWELACTCRLWNDFVSFDPRMPEDMSLFIHRIHRDEAKIAEIEKDVWLFLAEIEETIEKLQKRPASLRDALAQSVAA